MILDRRTFLTSAALLALAPLGGCGTASLGSVEGSLAMGAGQSHLSQIRAENGLPPLTADAELGRAALEQAKLMAASGRMAHTTGWRKDFASRIDGTDIRGAAAENVAFGRMDPEELFSRWMNSAGHRRNMLDPRFSRFGLAHATDPREPSRRYWALVLAG